MKRILFLIILATTQFAVSAQTNPKIQALQAHLKEKGVKVPMKFSNIGGDGLRMNFSVSMPLYDDDKWLADYVEVVDVDSLFKNLSGVAMDEKGNYTINGMKIQEWRIGGKSVMVDGKIVMENAESKIDSSFRAKAATNRDVYNLVRHTIAELQEDAAESYSYEYHKNGADTIITTIALRHPCNDNQQVYTYKFDSSPVPQVQRAPEWIHFDYKNTEKIYLTSPYVPLANAYFCYNGIIDSTLTATKDFDFATLQKKLDPLFKSKSIKRHTLLCRHDQSFDRYAYNDSLIRIGQPRKRIQSMTFRSMGPGGESRYTIYKFTSEEQARNVLNQVMDCIRQQIDADPYQAYEVVYDAYFGTSVPTTIFSALPCSETIIAYRKDKTMAVKTMEIKTYMDPDGSYFIFNECQGDDTFPYEWKTLKEFINGNKVYYKDSL